MAQRRMFSLKIVSSDAFLDMPSSSRELYFQLGMYADDDGFVNPKKVIRMIGASDDDLKILIGKRFVLQFQNGVVVIKHWLINNLVRKDFYQETVYVEEKKLINTKENKAYTECQQIVNNLAPQVRLGKVRLENTSVAKATVRKSNYNKLQDLDKKLSVKLVEALKEFSPTGELDGDYKLDNIFPAKVVAKQIAKFIGKDFDNPEHHEEIVAQFKGLISKLDEFERNNTTKMSYIKYNFNRLAAKASKK